MLKTLGFFAFFLPAVAFGATVGLIDSGLDVDASLVRGRLHESAMRGSALKHPVTGKDVTWWDYNNRQFHQMVNAFVSFYGEGTLLGSSYIKTLASQTDMNPWLAAQAPEVRANLMTWLVSAGPTMGPLHENGVMHGTESARLMVSSLSADSRLFHFALPVPVVVETGKDAPSTMAAFVRPVREYFEAVGERIHSENIRVVQISLGYELKWFREIVRRALSMSVIPINQLTDVAPQHLMDAFYAEYERFIDSHPDTVFVMESGHGGADLTLMNHPLHRLHKRNTLVVGVLNESGRRATFSNYGADVLDLAAVGQPVKTVAAGIRLVGLPMAAPQVTARLAEFAEELPGVGGSALIEEFLRVHSTIQSIDAQLRVPVLNKSEPAAPVLLDEEEDGDCVGALLKERTRRSIRRQGKKRRPPKD